MRNRHLATYSRSNLKEPRKNFFKSWSHIIGTNVLLCPVRLHKLFYPRVIGCQLILPKHKPNSRPEIREVDAERTVNE
jgi:hypothetical protein